MLNERFITQRDASTLSRLAEGLLRSRDVKPNLAQRLVDLLSNVIPLPETCTREDHVRLHSAVTYRLVGATGHGSVVIACPQDVGHVLASVSILSPLTMALIGHRVGSIVEVHQPFGKVQYVEIVGITSIEAFHLA